ncbi:hypothetical protein TD95_002566 [Thielaviopsis punctulata]|uniref:Copper acquisition factor BIM1-like domain-containing protein n=1 Tax=Thielaviopsis punctulata TaxID=72032 RepID=A0A0F4ZMI8_9PEZI|nr:hypothetical protein TD95_002566 [Thielaviopsis punctulata]
MLWSAVFAAVVAPLAAAHIVLSYPGTRGNNLITNDTFPYGMQWMYPCGGMTTSRNRTYWPTTGGAVSFQPGWFQGHSSAFIHINLGFGTDGPANGPPNMSLPMLKDVQLIGPSNTPYPGSVCFPQVPLPTNMTVKAGDLATIQVVELAQHGAALYACVDIIFADPGDPKIALVNDTNCVNSSDIGFADLYTIQVDEANGKINAIKSSSTSSTVAAAQSLRLWPVVVGALLVGLM